MKVRMIVRLAMLATFALAGCDEYKSVLEVKETMILKTKSGSISLPNGTYQTGISITNYRNSPDYKTTYLDLQFNIDKFGKVPFTYTNYKLSNLGTAEGLILPEESGQAYPLRYIGKTAYQVLKTKDVTQSCLWFSQTCRREKEDKSGTEEYECGLYGSEPFERVDQIRNTQISVDFLSPNQSETVAHLAINETKNETVYNSQGCCELDGKCKP